MDDEETRLFLHALLQNMFSDVSIYYRPPGNIILNYPCIVYEKKAYEPSFGNSTPYVVGMRFQVSLLSKLPGYTSVRDILSLNGQGAIVADSDSYENDDIVHDVFTVYVNSL